MRLVVAAAALAVFTVSVNAEPAFEMAGPKVVGHMCNVATPGFFETYGYVAPCPAPMRTAKKKFKS
jgi:hypothetical protein